MVVLRLFTSAGCLFSLVVCVGCLVGCCCLPVLAFSLLC